MKSLEGGKCKIVSANLKKNDAEKNLEKIKRPACSR